MFGTHTKEKIMNASQIIEKNRKFNTPRNSRQIFEKFRDFSLPVVMCFIGYAKAIDCMNWKKLFKVLREMGVPVHTMD